MLLRSCALVLALFATTSWALIETYEFSSAELEVRYRQLSNELRCPKCQNQNIADSDAPIAQDLRQTLHRQLEEGATNDEILDYMVARYGEFVRYRPNFSSATAVLWFAPLLLFIAAGLVLMLTLRKGDDARIVDQDSLSEQNQDRLQTLLDETEHDS
ncbi:MAG: cytochrome c-type biogenesis protein CcmH [Halioglobus sp.]|jgi:cytochrome c-type biogenesis protein CcmH